MEYVFCNIPDKCRENDAACRNTSKTGSQAKNTSIGAFTCFAVISIT